MGPDSILLLVLVFAFAVGLVVLVAGTKHLTIKIVAGLLALGFAATGGIGLVNDYYGYYQSWSQLSSDLSGNYTSFTSVTVARRQAGIEAGRVEAVELRGGLSGINRPGLVYLPPQYFQAAYANTDFPVVELLHGTPGNPSNWVVQLHIATTLDRLISLHQMGPVIAVMPTMSVGSHFQECVNGSYAQDDTYITQDVRNDIVSQFRASSVPSEWAVEGYSSGGYCAANLALRHPAEFGAAGIMDGYFRPSDGPAAAALGHNAQLEQENNPLLAAQKLALGAHPLPAFWLSAGTGDAADIAAARAFSRALHGIERVTLFREPGASHNFYAWTPAIPPMLTWTWEQIAPPELRVDFPIAGPVRQSLITGGESPETELAERNIAARLDHFGRPTRRGTAEHRHVKQTARHRSHHTSHRP